MIFSRTLFSYLETDGNQWIFTRQKHGNKIHQLFWYLDSNVSTFHIYIKSIHYIIDSPHEPNRYLLITLSSRSCNRHIQSNSTQFNFWLYLQRTCFFHIFLIFSVPKCCFFELCCFQLIIEFLYIFQYGEIYGNVTNSDKSIILEPNCDQLNKMWIFSIWMVLDRILFRSILITRKPCQRVKIIHKNVRTAYMLNSCPEQHSQHLDIVISVHGSIEFGHRCFMNRMKNFYQLHICPTIGMNNTQIRIKWDGNLSN